MKTITRGLHLCHWVSLEALNEEKLMIHVMQGSASNRNIGSTGLAQIRTTILRICAISLRICSSSSRSLPSSTCFMFVMLSWTTVKPSRTSRRTLPMFSFCQLRSSSILRRSFSSVACNRTAHQTRSPWFVLRTRHTHLQHHRLSIPVSHCVLLDLVDASKQFRHLFAELSFYCFLKCGSLLLQATTF